MEYFLEIDFVLNLVGFNQEGMKNNNFYLLTIIIFHFSRYRSGLLSINLLNNSAIFQNIIETTFIRGAY